MLVYIIDGAPPRSNTLNDPPGFLNISIQLWDSLDLYTPYPPFFIFSIPILAYI